MFKKETKNSFTGKRLGSITDLQNYVKEEYGYKEMSLTESKMICNIRGLIQADYGKAYDCSLTCITCVTKYLLKNNPEITNEEIYNTVVGNTEWYSYNGDKFGTVPVFVDNVLKETLKDYKINYKSYNKTFKGVPLVGYTMKDIKTSIAKELPVILNLSDDNRDYYKNHSVTIIGYYEYKVLEKNNKVKTLYFLKVFDNWMKSYAFIDYQKMSNISSITLLKKN